MKYAVTFNAHGSATYEVDADSEDEAKEKAAQLCDLHDVELSDWDFENEPEVETVDSKGEAGK